MKRILSLFVALLSLVGCKSSQQSASYETYSVKPENYRVVVEQEMEHSTSRYTQGLFFDGGSLYESAGQYGESKLYKTDFATGKILSEISYPKSVFAEGACVLNDKVFLITWNEKLCYVYNKQTMAPEGTFSYRGEGWGLTTDGKSLIMSNGSSVISFRDPETFIESKKIPVTIEGKELSYLNELEYIDGKIWANVYTTDYIVIINPDNGVVEGKIDCSNLLLPEDRDDRTDVLNGIAYDPSDGGIYITGKYWPKMFKITLERI